MSQDDSRLTPKEKQEIVDKFAAKLEFPTEAQKQKVRDEWREEVKKSEKERERKWADYNREISNQEDLKGDPAVNPSYKS
jgi:transketolase